ncbi:MAG: hypothetical protein P1V36_00695 [Planctomycetota bacterium]|nr:hypothetical protein [Planctomycetota bacterium]
MNQRCRFLVGAALLPALLLALAGCSSNNNPAQATGDPNATAPVTSTDPGTRYLDPAEPIGAVTVETPPVDPSWTGGPTSIARPVPGAAGGSPDGPALGSPQPGSYQGTFSPATPASPGGLPAPARRSTPPPPPPPPLR